MGKSNRSGYCNVCKEDREQCDQCGSTVCSCNDCRCYDMASFWELRDEG